MPVTNLTLVNKKWIQKAAVFVREDAKMQEANAAALDALMNREIPPQFAKLVIPSSDVTVVEQLSDDTVLVEHSGSKKRFVFKTLSEDSGNSSKLRFSGTINSLLSTRFYFLAPIQGFRTEPDFGVYYDFYAQAHPLTTITGMTGTQQTLIAAFVCYALAYLEYRMVLHGALHSGNILITNDFMPILTDYGLARTKNYFTKNTTDAVSWIAPELLLGVHPNYNIDLYSFGVLLYELSEGKRPYSELTVNEYMEALRNGTLPSVEFEKTGFVVQNIIVKCMDRNPDMRPSFCELYFLFLNGKILFPGATARTVKQVLAQYPVSFIFEQSQSIAYEEVLVKTSPRDVVPSGARAHFTEPLKPTEPSCSPDTIQPFCEQSLSSVRKESGKPEMVSSILSQLKSMYTESPNIEFFEAIVNSGFLSQVWISNEDQAGVLLDLVAPILYKEFRLFTNKIYNSVTQLLIYKPNEMLNLFSNYFTLCDVNAGEVENNIRLFFWMGCVFVSSRYSVQYLKILKYLWTKTRGQFKVDITALLLAFANSSDAKVSKDAFLFLAHHDMSAVQLNQKLVEILMEGDISWDLMATVLLQAKSIPVSGRLVATLIARAETDTCALPILLKYATTDDAHAGSMTLDLSWMSKGLPTIQDTFRLFLAVFSCPYVRASLAASEHFMGLLKGGVEAEGSQALAVIWLVIQSTFTAQEVCARASSSGFVDVYLRTTVYSSDIQLMVYGIVFVSFIAGVCYIPGLEAVAEQLVTLFTAHSRELGEQLLKAFVALARYNPCMDVFQRRGIVTYFKNIAKNPRFGAMAQSFLQYVP